MTPRDLLLSEWSTVERVIAFTCRKRGLRGADAEDFASIVKVRLFDNDCDIVRQFRNTCKFSTYLTTVVMRIYVDEYIKQTGKWHASAEAQRIGPNAVELEKQVMRDGRAIEEAAEQLKMPRTDAEAILARLPQRQPRRAPMPLDEITAETLRARECADVLVIDSERWKIAEKTAAVLRDEITRLDEQDRLMLQLQLEKGMKISEIARALQMEQKPLYVRREKVWKQLRAALERAGVTWEDVRDIIDHFPEGVDLGVRKLETRPSKHEGSVEVHQQESSK